MHSACNFLKYVLGLPVTVHQVIHNTIRIIPLIKKRCSLKARRLKAKSGNKLRFTKFRLRIAPKNSTLIPIMSQNIIGMAGTLFCSLLPALSYPCNGSHPFGLLTCRWASNKSGRPRRGTGRGLTSAYRQGPKKCSKSRLA